MRKFFALILAAALLLGLAACGKGKGEIEEEEKAQELYIVLEMLWGETEEYPYEGEATVESLAAGLREKTGLDFDVTSNDDDGLTVDWSAGSCLFDGDAATPAEYLGITDYDGMVWFMLDSLCLTLARNIGVQEVFYTMDGGKELVLEKLVSPVSFEGPYMLSGYYLSNIIDDVIPDPADVAWAGEYGSGKGMLHIVNYNGESFRFTLSGEGDTTIEGTAALDPENPLFAEYMQLSFHFNLSDETIDCAGGDYGAFEATYIRTENAVG